MFFFVVVNFCDEFIVVSYIYLNMDVVVEIDEFFDLVIDKVVYGIIGVEFYLFGLE